MYILRFDGLFRLLKDGPASGQKNISAQHGGFMSYGWLISRHQAVIAHGHGVYARGQGASSNLAEYLALIEGLEALTDLGVRREAVEIVGDAKCVIDQMCGLAAVKSPQALPLYRRAARLAQHFEALTWTWTPRQGNREADQLTRRAIRQMRADREGYQAALDALLAGAAGRRQQNRLLPLLDLRVIQF
jgi:ribonuclease HI